MRGTKRVGLALSLALLIGAISAPASATQPGTDPDLVDGHKIWICHATRSLSNPYVKILIDIAAWDIENPDSNDHGPLHHLRTKGGITWGDYALESADDTCSLPPPPDEPGTAGHPFDGAAPARTDARPVRSAAPAGRSVKPAHHDGATPARREEA